MNTSISSAQNPRIKDLLALQEKSRLRKERGLFVVEGIREIRHCIEGGYIIKEIFHNPSMISEEKLLQMFPAGAGDVTIASVNDYVYEKIGYRGSTEGAIAIVKARELSLNGLDCICGGKRSPFIIVTEEVEKPGNIGALLRTADACGADAVIICNPLTDIYNPNIIRSSLGGLFTNRIAVCSSTDAIQWLKSKGISIYTAQLQDSVPYYSADFTAPSAIVLGSEAKGLSPEWREASDRKIIIPMLGRIDSLNVSISAAVLCYEVVRQRITGNTL